MQSHEAASKDNIHFYLHRNEILGSRKRPRLAIIGGYAPSLINFRGALLKAFVDLGWEVIACAPQNDASVIAQLAEIGASYRRIRLNRTGLNPISDIVGLIHLCWVIFWIKPVLVLSYTVKPVIFGSIAAKLVGVTSICSMITGAGSTLTKNSPIRKVVEILYRLALGANQIVFFQNPDDQLEFKMKGLTVDGRKTVVLPGSGVDLEQFPFSSVRSETVVFLMIARLIAEKGIDEFVKAARLLGPQYHHCRFVLLGPYDANLTALQPTNIEEWIREGVIEYAGETRDVRPFLQESTVFVLPSYYREGTPRTILEAMAIGRPIITADAPGCRETIRRNAEAVKSTNAEISEIPAGITRGENGFLVPIRDAASLAWAMEQFLLRPELISTMGQKSREYAEERYDVHKVNAVILRELGLVDDGGASDE